MAQRKGGARCIKQRKAARKPKKQCKACAKPISTFSGPANESR